MRRVTLLCALTLLFASVTARDAVGLDDSVLDDLSVDQITDPGTDGNNITAMKNAVLRPAGLRW